MLKPNTPSIPNLNPNPQIPQLSPVIPNEKSSSEPTNKFPSRANFCDYRWHLEVSSSWGFDSDPDKFLVRHIMVYSYAPNT